MNILGISITRTSKAQNRITELNGVRLTPTQQLAYMQAETAAFDMMSAIRWAKRLAWVVLLIVMTISYEDQNHYLLSIGMRQLGAYLIPAAFDVATVLCVAVIGTAAMRWQAKTVALVIVLFPTVSSAYINVQASPTTEVAVVFVMVVALIPGIELVKAFMGPNYDYMRRTESQLLGVATPENPSPPVQRGVPVRKPDAAEKDARRRAGYAKKSPADKAAWTTQYRERRDRLAPVSPGQPPVSAPSVDEVAEIAGIR
jgi:hypothetical protein